MMNAVREHTVSLRLAVESGNYTEARRVLADWNVAVTTAWRTLPPGDPSAEGLHAEVMEILEWAIQAVSASQAQCTAALVSLPQPAAYAAPDARRDSWTLQA